MDEILEITRCVTDVLEALGIPYAIGGSLASSLYGIPRATQDVDIVAAVEARHVMELFEALRDRFYLDEHAIRDAVALRTSFNLIHLETLFKVDIFVARDDSVSRGQLQRAQRFPLANAHELVVASPEDVVAHKLYWYRLGDEVSDRQWRDAVGVLQVAGERLDLPALRDLADRLGVADLLRRACDEAGLGP